MTFLIGDSLSAYDAAYVALTVTPAGRARVDMVPGSSSGGIARIILPMCGSTQWAGLIVIP